MDKISIELDQRQMTSLIVILDLALKEVYNTPEWVMYDCESFIAELERQSHIRFNWCHAKNCDWIEALKIFREEYKEYLILDPVLKERYIEGFWSMLDGKF